ncbi:MAG: DUF433 domain-containing protein [Promethearchaeota archaeon]
MSKIDQIVRDPEICGGQPTIKGTRVLVTVILDWIKEGISFEEILENFPTISLDDIKAIIDYAKEMISGEIVIYGENQREIPAG